MEVQDLRVQLNHSISREEVEVLKRELQKTEKQRAQLADHIEVRLLPLSTCPILVPGILI